MTFEEWKKTIDKGDVIDTEENNPKLSVAKMTIAGPLLLAPYFMFQFDLYKCKIHSSCPEHISLVLP